MGIRYRIRYKAKGSSRVRYQFQFSPLNRGTDLESTLLGLSPDTAYKIDIQLEIRYRECFVYAPGNYSDPISVSTNSTGGFELYIMYTLRVKELALLNPKIYSTCYAIMKARFFILLPNV